MGSFIPPTPIDPLYEPSVKLTKLPATTSLEDILSVLDRDGGVILTDFGTQQDLDQIDRDVEKYREKHQSGDQKRGSGLLPAQTLAIAGLAGKSPAICRICESPVLDNLRKAILQDEWNLVREDSVTPSIIYPLLSLAITFWIGPGGARQRLHRDDVVHGVKHDHPFDLRRAGQIGCLIAGTKVTRENGATMVIPGSHKWDDKRQPRVDEVCFAGESV